MRDLYRQEILEGLAAPRLDGDTFEACVCDLLRKEFPVVPSRGGSDAGMDGAIADSEGPPFPLVCTTGQDVIGNLRGSLDSYLRAGRPRRKAVLATSQALTPQRRRNLEDAAEEKGFTLIQIIEREGMADRLYHSPRWCKELLDLAARPSALAPVPDSRRPLFEVELIGRDRDIQWLRQTEGDRIIAGEPGSGKTFLLYKYAQEVGALFVVRSDEEAIASALLEQQPSIVIVDDAHVHLERIELLRSLRRIRGHEFSILAATWKGDVDSVSEALGTVPESKTRRLELLTRKELVEVYRQAGIEEGGVGRDVLRELVTQASNKPGLAMTIATLWHQGAWQEVVTGEALRKSLVPQLERLVGLEAVSILASFGLGGDRGFEMVRVGRFLSLSLADVQHKTARLAAGGVLAERADMRLAIQPPVLRSALLREAFFSGRGTDLPWRDLMTKPKEDELGFRSSVQALIAAAEVGVEVPRQELQALVRAADSEELWRSFALLDEPAAVWVLAHFPGDLTTVAPETLELCPRKAAQALLRHGQSQDDKGQERVLRRLEQWLQNLRIVGITDPLAKRRLLVDEARLYIAGGGEEKLAYRAIVAALSTRLAATAAGPGSRREFRLLDADLDLAQLDEIWALARQTLRNPEAIPWPELRHRLSPWIRLRRAAAATVAQEAKGPTLAQQIVQDLIPLAEGRPWIASVLTEWAGAVGTEVDVPHDPAFEALYPAPGSDQPKLPSLKALAESLATLSPEEIACKLLSYHAGATMIGRAAVSSREDLREAHLGHFLATVVDSPEVWLEAFFRQRLPIPYLLPLLLRITGHQQPGWIEWVQRFLADESLAFVGLQAVLRQPNPPQHLLEMALTACKSAPFFIESMCSQGQVPVLVCQALLNHPEPEVRLATAVGEWLAEPRGTVREELSNAWRSTLLEAAAIDFIQHPNNSLQLWLVEVLSHEQQRELLPQWICRRLPAIQSVELDEVLPELIARLSPLKRQQVLQQYTPPDEGSPPGLWKLLVQGSPRLYRQVLQRPLSKYERLEPLEGIPGDAWSDLVELALGKGFTSEDIAHACLREPFCFAGGPAQSALAKWDEAFAAFEDHPHEGVRETAREARRMVQKRSHAFEDWERQTELHGLR